MFAYWFIKNTLGLYTRLILCCLQSECYHQSTDWVLSHNNPGTCSAISSAADFSKCLHSHTHLRKNTAIYTKVRVRSWSRWLVVIWAYQRHWTLPGNRTATTHTHTFAEANKHMQSMRQQSKRQGRSPSQLQVPAEPKSVYVCLK